MTRCLEGRFTQGVNLRAQLGGRSLCPWVTAGDRSFPPVLARMWHGSLNGAAAGHELPGSCPWPTAQQQATFRPGDSSESTTEWQVVTDE